MAIPFFSLATCNYSSNNNSELLLTHNLFSQYFEVIEANSASLLNEVFALRYQVYCLENSFEKASCFLNKKEKDIFDDHSLHVLIRHRATGEAVATVRLVLPNSSNPGNQLPIETCCTSLMTATQADVNSSSTHLPAEISRFAVSKNARQRIIDIPPIEAGRLGRIKGGHSHWTRLLYSHLTLELVAAAIQLSHKHGITHWYSLATSALIRALKRFGLQITPFSPPIEHRGKRYPCLDDLKTLLAGVYQEYPDAWNILTSEGIFWPESGCKPSENKNRYSVPHTAIAPWQMPPLELAADAYV
ncbi:PEP-CTERM/exosortase system-associated acyltransferase [Nitrosococcus watsonii]|uniref:PEP-CTERM/exosortase system-associated acyltransferase n=1 Tax=Nitrosococcus watsoni (strain C-113) TaxID=105559 RepID=D8K6X5_NITWC|nr:PEP-CTERM/exosortase system-associated acyltransferase [Nitrosococcus watsonii]ADJ28652.1 conserved hypothetical protein [Nitrosococcus watsonii C-113]